MDSSLAHLFGSAAANTALLAVLIILVAIVAEDVTTVIVGLLAGTGVIPVLVALPALYIGVVLSDLVLYGLGRLAGRHPRLAHFVDHRIAKHLRLWLEARFLLNVFSVRFIPGMRMPVYTASGYFRTPIYRFVLAVMAATSLWTTGLFFSSYWFGSLTADWVGWARWAIVGAFILLLVFLGRRNLRAYLKAQEEAPPSAE